MKKLSVVKLFGVLLFVMQAYNVFAREAPAPTIKLASEKALFPQSTPIKTISNKTANLEVIACIDHYPPMQIVAKDGQVSGRNIDLLTVIANRVGFSITYKVGIPFPRCLNCMRSGDCDLMIGLLDVDDRRDYMDLFLYSGNSDKAFYINKNAPHKIARYEDLNGLSVGVNRGYRYFEKFDKEQSLFKKVNVDSREQLFKMLMSKRVDTIICSVDICESLFAKYPQWQAHLVRASYTFSQENPTFLGISKKSKAMIDKDKFQSVVDELYSSGESDRILDSKP
ncbi:amino acid ABC transporter substrate-binding protein [Aliikangiella marina]|uniref:Amino acid ABC transporter substrate-binding protein n=1 Tax=Aliikangiella marina TaxID=1712262 RepID=A0A545T112_9GAMM|nr:transporter substrate-binding domain-containing protein [Aliikangiella marina]TQV70879.1 amino acid ABC transporter substrate-binding protein [Aliikangiella marina]